MEVWIVEGPDKGRSFKLGASSVVGRDPTAAIDLTDDEVSRRHALVTVAGTSIRIEDLGSSNGTYVGRGEVMGEYSLAIGDRFRVGRTVLELRGDEGAPNDPEEMRPTKIPLPRLTR